MTASTVSVRRRRRRGAAVSRESRTAYTFLAPTIVLLGLFVFLPIVWAAGVSLEHTNGFGAARFIGDANYTRLLTDPLFWRAAGNTLLFTVVVTPLSMALGLGAALLLNSALPARAIFRSILILPMAVSGVATALVGLLLFDENTGVIDGLLRQIGLPAVHWQSAGLPAFASVVAMTVWWRVGFNMLIYLAGLQSISTGVYEAAQVDGASSWQRLRLVTVPLLGPSSFFLLLINVIYSFQVFDIVFVLTGGGPRNATAVIVTYAYEQGFTTRDQGYAAAIGMVLLVVAVVFSGLQWRLNRSRDVVE